MTRAWLVAALLVGACGAGDDGPGGGRDVPEPWAWDLPPGFPAPVVPEDNPMSAAKVDLGRHLFYDTKLSGNGTQACASCHRQERAFTDGLGHAVGSTGEVHPRGSMSLTNIAYAPTLAWANPLLTSLEAQALVPLFGEEPVELGLADREAELLQRLRDSDLYPPRFAAAFPDDPEPVSVANIVRALAAFQRTLVSGDSPYDRYFYGGDEGALSEAALRGLDLFNSERLECFHCHGGFNFSDARHVYATFDEVSFHNTGLFNVDGQGAYPPPNTGVHEVTGRAEDMGRFKAPTLRNIAVTAPYMHDGSMQTLDEVLDFYAAGGRVIVDGPDAGDGTASPLKSEFIVGFELSEAERADLLAFLEALTDERFLTNPAFASPFE